MNTLNSNRHMFVVLAGLFCTVAGGSTAAAGGAEFYASPVLVTVTK